MSSAAYHGMYHRRKLKVVGYKNGKAIKEQVIRTAGKPAGIKLSADRPIIAGDGKDLSYVTVSIVDKDGNLCPEAVTSMFKVEGAGKLLAVGVVSATGVVPSTIPQGI